MGVLIAVCCIIALAALFGWGRSELRRREALLELRRTLQLFEVSLEMNSTILKRDLLAKIMETSARVMNAEASSVILVDAATDELYFELATGEKGDEVREIRLKIGEGIAGWVAETGNPVKIDDAAQDSRWSSKVADRVEYATRNLLCVPIVSKGAIIGVLQVLNKREGRCFTDSDLKLLESIAAPTAVSLENAMLYEALEKSMAALKTTTAAKERMESELRIAHHIQMGLLPTGEPRGRPSAAPGGPAADIHAQLRPAREVGGDFYDYFWIGEQSLFFALGDVSDKGIPAALFMTVIMTLIQGTMKESLTPGQLLTAVNRALYKEDSAMFATICCGVLDVQSGRVAYSDGGHCTPYIVRQSGAVEPLQGDKGLPLAVLDDFEYADNEFTLLPGERLLFYTDGISEAEDGAKAQFGLQRLQRFLAGVQRDEPGEALLQSLIREVDTFTDGAVQSDDIAVMTVARSRE
jgi:serine phosphatase RsbU (regulator of sigma subunit)/putative methionine-R-sulfoxide reductase with GAF domain